jgi:hypothetical protein
MQLIAAKAAVVDVLVVELFAAPLMGEDIGHLTRSFAGKDFIDGNLDKSIFEELTQDVVTRWDES